MSLLAFRHLENIGTSRIPVVAIGDIRIIVSSRL